MSSKVYNQISSENYWYVDNGRLNLRLPAGSVILPTVDEVHGAEFKQLRSIRGEIIPVKPSEDLPYITFSRFPMALRIEVKSPSSDLSSGSSCRIVTAKHGKVYPLDSKFDDDQILISDKWHPVDHDELSEISGILKQSDIFETGFMSLKQYFNLLKSGSNLVVFDIPRFQ